MRVHINTPQASAPSSQDAAEKAAPREPLLIEMGIGWTRNPKDRTKLTSATPGEYAREIERLNARIARLEADLNECLEFLEGQSDVVDGDYGEPSPNRAMQLVSMIDETLNGRPI